MKIRLLFVFIIILTSCVREQKREIPEWLVPEDKMIGFLIEMHIVESKMTRLGIKRDSTAQIFAHYQNELFEKYDIVDSNYFKSYNYYLEDVDAMSRMYSIIVDSLSVREQVSKQTKKIPGIPSKPNQQKKSNQQNN